MLRRSVTAVVVVAVVGAAACGGSSSTPTPGLRPQASGLSPESPDGGVVVGDPLAEPEPAPFTIPTEKPAAVGTVTRLAGREKVPLSHGLSVRYADQRHKHRVDGGATGFYDLVFERGGRELAVTLTADDQLEAEVDALGILVVVNGLQTSLELDVTVVGETPAPLDEDAAMTLVEERARAQGLPVSGAGYGSADGVFWYAATPAHGGDERWRGYVGLYSRRVWFGRPNPPMN